LARLNFSENERQENPEARFALIKNDSRELFSSMTNSSFDWLKQETTVNPIIFFSSATLNCLKK